MTPEVYVRPTAPKDLPWVLARESDADVSRWVVAWPEDRHRRAITAPDEAHYVARSRAGIRVGYAILKGLNDLHGGVELTRVVASPPGMGYGRAIVRWAVRYAFEVERTHRLWLDVLEHNERARALYASEGFVGEGHLRNAALIRGRHESLLIMSMLAGEYRRLASPHPACSPPTPSDTRERVP